MTNPELTTTIATAGVAATFNLIIGEMFDIPKMVIFIVFTGSFLGLLFRPSVEMPRHSIDKFYLFLKTCVWLIAITMIASWLVPWATKVIPFFPEKTVAAFLGFALMLEREQISSFVKHFIEFKRQKDKT